MNIFTYIKEIHEPTHSDNHRELFNNQGTTVELIYFIKH